MDDEHLDQALRTFTEKNLTVLHVLLSMHDYPTIVSIVKRMFQDTVVYVNQNSSYSLQHAIMENVQISNEERQELSNVLVVENA